MGELRQFDEGLPGELRALAEALRRLFAGLRISERRYAARRSYDSSTISRYLSGRRLPPWEFILNLLHDVAEERGTVPTAETTEMLRSLHIAALEAGKSPTHKVQLLEQQLALADQQARRVASRERWLEDTLRDKEHRIRDLQMQFRELQASISLDPGPSARGMDRDAERARLCAEIRQLKEELEQARALHRQAEERCDQLERQLAEAEGGPREDGPGELTAVGPEAVDESTIRTVIHGDVFYNINSQWAIDEHFVESMTVKLLSDGRIRGNGLLVDRTTVVTTWSALGALPDGVPVLVIASGEAVNAEVAEWLPSDPEDRGGREVFPNLAVLRLASPIASSVPTVNFDGQPPPGSQLLVSGYVRSGPGAGERYSCLLEVKGRTGSWIRVEGELVNGLGGAPAFHVGTGALVGLVGVRSRDGSKGLLVPAEALRDLTTLSWPD
ncbi:hypothetical protein [Streptomyces netropsis]|uniref:Transcriptional regulator with XRE-family HTH domain n=1 Tax=Streptomyces netropsis TaxID=55404 RepID=A0A7W7LAN4_STRNE|nr:hypothetical protein [Streptomyces netropsis]MBB4886719.1 transcriptional regulator with XRE-family HTH domain [Streptomyces netropsis]GGR22648.1 hypothetical protein GCM10010219_29100 [Streptomyces netropsis]